MLKLDLHTHSTASPDGGLALADYRRILDEGLLDYLAVTDHNTLAEARRIHRHFGERIIIGSEITTKEGDVIGLYLREDIPPGLDLAATLSLIKAQGGLAMLPHPFERWQRASVNPAAIGAEAIAQIDIIESYNSRSLSLSGGFKARRFASRHGIVQASNSDAHGSGGIGRAYNLVERPPTPRNLPRLLADGRPVRGVSRPISYLEPALNRLRRRRAQTNSIGDAGAR